VETSASQVISTILKHDDKVTSYKIALLRAINDVVMSYPDLSDFNKDVAIPLKVLARYWLAYYWPFYENTNLILQGPRSIRNGKLSNDMAFRPELTNFREEWANYIQSRISSADGFLIISEFQVPRRRITYSKRLLDAYNQVIRKISHTIQMPIRYAGEGQWSVFDKPKKYLELQERCTAIPGTKPNDNCIVVNLGLWSGFQEMSLYVEALCIHEWCLFTERKNENPKYERGKIYQLLTEHPDNRRPLTWERNQVDILLMEEKEFVCPWTQKRIHQNVAYDLDHLIPISVYPINELWNLIPSDPYFNSHKKRNRMPTYERLENSKPFLAMAYENYLSLQSTAKAIKEDTDFRFSNIRTGGSYFSGGLAESVVNFMDRIATARNISRF
jgi:hypothetical protein